MKRIELTQGVYALIDDEDYHLVNQYKWYAWCSNRRWYASTRKKGEGLLLMHRLIMNAEPDQEVDHKEHYDDYIDNRRSNLRFCTTAENQHNQRKQLKLTSSQYKGVSWNKRNQKWQTTLEFNRKFVHLGYFDDEIEAARAYNMDAIKCFGEFAKLNDV